MDEIELKKRKRREASKKYREANKQKIHDYNIKYNKTIKETKPIREEPTPTPINIKEILTETKTNKRTKKRKINEIIPSFKTRDENISQSTINDYISKFNIIHRIFTNKTLSKSLKVQLINLFNNNDFNEDLILSQMPYINNDIEPTINTLREKYKNDNTFKTYLNILVVITSHLKTLNKSVYQTLTKLNIYLNEVITDKRKENKINKEDENKIIDLDKSAIITNINKLDNINDRLIYALYSLFPARRLEWRLTKIILDETTNINDVKYNYLILKDGKYQIIFNNYKTATTYGKQIFKIDDNELTNILNDYIIKSRLLNGDFLFSLKTDKNKVITQSNFSYLISNVFKKVYNIPISIRFIRINWVSNLLNKNPSIKEMELLAYMMGHGTTEQQLYKKVIKKEMFIFSQLVPVSALFFALILHQLFFY
jgi:hypothetical protein